jgi:hypothetical protein
MKASTNTNTNTYIIILVPRLGFEIPNFPALSIGFSLCFATLIRLILSCCKCKKILFKCAVKIGCCKTECKKPKCLDFQDKQFGTVIVGYNVFRFHCSKIVCGIPWTFFNMWAFVFCCCCRGACQWRYCGAATFVPKVGVWEIDEEAWVEKFIGAQELATRKASDVTQDVKDKILSWET